MAADNDPRFSGLHEKRVPGLNVLGTGKIVHNEFDISGMRTLRMYAAVFISRGSGIYYSSPKSRAVYIPEGSLFFVFPGQPHRYGPDPGGWTQYWSVFEGYLPEMLEKDGYLDRNDFIRTNLSRWEIQSSFEQLLSLSRRKPGDYHIRLSAVMYRLLLSAIPGLSQPDEVNGTRNRLAEEVRIHLNENMLTRRSVRQILSFGGYSYNYLRAVFRDSAGESPLQYLNRMRIGYVCEQLTYSSRPIKQVAYDAGFDDPQYFARMFKKTTGITPDKYRRSIVSNADVPALDASAADASTRRTHQL